MTAFLNVRYNASHDAGREIAAKYNVDGYPTLVVVDCEGAEIDRIVGFLGPTPFLKEIGRIQKGENTLMALRAAHEKAPEDAAAALAYVKKLLKADPAAAVPLLDGLAERLRGKDPAAEADVGLVRAQVLLARRDVSGALAVFEQVIEDFPGTAGACRAALMAAQFVARSDPDRALGILKKADAAASEDVELRRGAAALEFALHVQLAEGALERRAELAGDDAQALNEVAWAAFERNLALVKAQEWARRAVEITKREDAAILDTLANLLFAAGKVDEAATIEEEALLKANEERLETDLAETLARFKAVQALRRESKKEVDPAK